MLERYVAKAAISKVIGTSSKTERKALEDFAEVLAGFTREEQLDYLDKLERMVKELRKIIK